MSRPEVVVFLGPSLAHADAAEVLAADYRPPVMRGDLRNLAPGTVVGLIDGVFEQDLSVSPTEIGHAVARGVVVFGGASMGALRAAEVPGVIGVGRIHGWYRDEVVVRDDEVALLFDESTGRALTVPTVNVRHAVDRLCRPGTIDRATGDRIVAAALDLPFKERTYRTILARAGLAGRDDTDDLAAMLETHDLKREDALAVLEAIDRHLALPPSAPPAAPVPEARPAPIGAFEAADEDVLVWESGDRVTDDELSAFLVFTGRLDRYARSAVADGPGGEVSAAEAQAVFDDAARRWGWQSPEEAKVTLADLGLDLADVDRACVDAAAADHALLDAVDECSDEFRRMLRATLFLDDLALKRETMRLGSLRFFAAAGGADGPVTADERRDVRAVLCRANRRFDVAAVRRRWAQLGRGDQAEQDAFVDTVALARRAGGELARAMRGEAPVPHRPAAGGVAGFPLGPCPKPPGERRFCLPVREAGEHAARLREVIGVTRVGMIGELGDLGGVQIAQAARPGGAWSSSYGSGKSLTPTGAVVGSIMEETEKWAQEQFRPDDGDLVAGSSAGLDETVDRVSPADLDLPYDSGYHPDLVLHWYPCVDLIGGGTVLVPVDALVTERRPHDICFTARGARKHLATNGLGCGFSREEAVLHAVCEIVERHALRLAELFLANPGGLGEPPYRFVDLATAPDRVRDLAGRLGRRGGVVRVLDITSDVAVPTFMAAVTRDQQRADGYGTHPDPGTAIEMALLEAAQTICSSVAGGREDLSITARSLGRHERPRPVTPEDAWFWADPDAVLRPVDRIDGLTSDDVLADLDWVLDRLRAAGVRQVPLLDLTVPAIEPAHVVRVFVPGLESNNPFHTGPRARLTLLRDLLPRWR